jgi:XTP/dITP diphosphohydrolase
MAESRRVVLATRNRGKVRELDRLLAPLALEVRALSGFDAPEVEESAPTFVENALLKARSAAAVSGLPAIADDSGIEVDVLGGAPGVRSARYAGIDASDADNNARLLRALSRHPVSARGARFRCVMVYLAHPEDPAPVIAEGVWRGEVASAPRGEHGFGYDPLFLDPSLGRTAAELSPQEKNAVSHRAQAAAALLERLRSLLA